MCNVHCAFYLCLLRANFVLSVLTVGALTVRQPCTGRLPGCPFLIQRLLFVNMLEANWRILALFEQHYHPLPLTG